MLRHSNGRCVEGNETDTRQIGAYDIFILR